MTTSRTPIGRKGRMRLTNAAIAAFRKMQKLETECTCSAYRLGWRVWKHPDCPACEEWSEQNSILRDELNLKPWDWPAITHP